MIYGIGTDLVAVARLRGIVQRHGDKIAQRVLAASEQAEYQTTPDKACFLAKRFAAKEAAAKALGTGFSGGLSLRHIVVAHDDRGKPLLKFEGYAAQLAERLGIGEAFVSVADERDYALAYVTLSRRSSTAV